MNQFSKILHFELKGYYTNKVFVGVTVFLVLAIIVAMFFPRILEIINGPEPDDGIVDNPGDPADPGDRDGLPVMLVSAPKEYGILDPFLASFTEYDVRASDEDEETIRSRVSSGEAECAFVFASLTEYKYYVGNLSLYDSNTFVADELLTGIYRMNAMIGEGLSPDKAGEILSTPITHETETLGQDQMHNYFYTYIMIYALYIVIMLYGQLVATSVATEKSSRAMELLVTSASPVSMMFGKVMAACLAGLSQLVVVFGAALVSYSANKSYWGDNDIVKSIFDMPPELFCYMLLFFMLGFLVYAFLYGAIGSTASKLEDINTSSMPITLLFIIGFIIVMIGIATSDVDSLMMRIASHVPFTSPMAMFARIAMSSVSPVEIAISIVILAASVVGIGYVSAKIYRIGVLLYGTPPKPGAIIKAIKNS